MPSPKFQLKSNRIWIPSQVADGADADGDLGVPVEGLGLARVRRPDDHVVLPGLGVGGGGGRLGMKRVVRLNRTSDSVALFHFLAKSLNMCLNNQPSSRVLSSFLYHYPASAASYGIGSRVGENFTR